LRPAYRKRADRCDEDRGRIDTHGETHEDHVCVYCSAEEHSRMEGRRAASGPALGSVDMVVVAWVTALVAITGLGMLPLFVYQLDLSTLTFSTPVPVVVGIGIELTAYAPTLAALLAVWLIPGGGGVRNLLRPVTRWRVGVGWYVLALAGPTALFVVGDLIRFNLGLALPAMWFAIPDLASFGFLLGALIAGSFGEEVGWRGLGQPRLQLHYGALSAAVIVGILWSAWHLWPVLAPGGLKTTDASDVVLTFLRLGATAIIYAWMYNSTAGSLLIVMLAHAGHNIAVRLVPLDATLQHGDPVVTLLLGLAAAIVVALTGPRWLNRRRRYPAIGHPTATR
jgi:membrane protease YdiL (CAAX protease family)